MKSLHFLFLLWASRGRRLAPELLAGLGSVLVSCREARGSWMSVRKTPCICPQEQLVTLLMEIVPLLSFQELSQKRAWELLRCCQRDSPKAKHAVFTAQTDLANPSPRRSRIRVLLLQPFPVWAGWHAWGLGNGSEGWSPLPSSAWSCWQGLRSVCGCWFVFSV